MNERMKQLLSDMEAKRSMAKNYAKSKKIEINFRAPNLRRGMYDR